MTKSLKYAERTYRTFDDAGRWRSFRVRVESSDLYIRAQADLSPAAADLVQRFRNEVLTRCSLQPEFLAAFAPVTRIEPCSALIDSLYRASATTGTGPMAAVAGAIAEAVGRELCGQSDEVIVENGGDIWLAITKPVSIGVYAGRSAFSGKIALRITPDRGPVGVCTSSGTVGPSFSFGTADSVTIIANNAALADAVATAAGNRVHCAGDLSAACSHAMEFDGVYGALLVFRDTFAVQGDIELMPL